MSKNSQLRRCFSLVSLFFFIFGCSSQKPELAQLDYPELTGLEAEAKASVENRQQALAALLASSQPEIEQAKAFADLGILYFAFGFHAEAQTCFENATLLHPENYRWHYYLGRLPQDNIAQNQQALERALEIAPEHVPSKVALAQIYQQGDRQAEVTQLFEEALATSPNHPVAHYQLGLQAMAQKQPQQAITHFEKTLEADPRASAAHYQMARAYQQLGNTQEAETQMALRGDRTPALLDPLMKAVMTPGAMAHYRLAEALRLSGKHQDAVKHYDQTVELLPEEIAPRMGRVLNLVQANLHAEALVRLRDDLQFFPNNSPLLHILARLLAASPDDSVRDGQKSLQLMHLLGKGDVNAEMVETLAMAFAEVGDFEQAIAFQKRALSVTDESDPTFFQRLQANMARYQAQKPCRQPWQPEAPFFRLNTYVAMQQMPAKPPAENAPAPMK